MLTLALVHVGVPQLLVVVDPMVGRAHQLVAVGVEVERGVKRQESQKPSMWECSASERLKSRSVERLTQPESCPNITANTAGGKGEARHPPQNRFTLAREATPRSSSLTFCTNTPRTRIDGRSARFCPTVAYIERQQRGETLHCGHLCGRAVKNRSAGCSQGRSDTRGHGADAKRCRCERWLDCLYLRGGLNARTVVEVERGVKRQESQKPSVGVLGF